MKVLDGRNHAKDVTLSAVSVLNQTIPFFSPELRFNGHSGRASIDQRQSKQKGSQQDQYSRKDHQQGSRFDGRPSPGQFSVAETVGLDGVDFDFGNRTY